jgi:hypothetical protein
MMMRDVMGGKSGSLRCKNFGGQRLLGEGEAFCDGILGRSERKEGVATWKEV